jgi:hypothetical protein
MTRIVSVSIAEPARDTIVQQARAHKPRRGHVFALAYMSSYTNPDGTPVANFRPGYMACSWPVDCLGPHWVVARLSQGLEFHFLPRVASRAAERYILDFATSALGLYSIEPAPMS